ncbi:MAG: glycine dehydrogenase, partial [Magnetococcales bacterium]|nr:glycine dehydrogenase [Magnetococcales bacterium]
MPFIPHTDIQIDHQLKTAGIETIADLFSEVPDALIMRSDSALPPGLNEMAMLRMMRDKAAQDPSLLCFIGGGAYEHHIPAAVFDLAGRGEFYTAYTPYQAEASQGTLQTLYEFQSMMTALTDMDISNASLYDGATALAESVLMAVRVQGRKATKRILMPKGVHPHYRHVVQTMVDLQGIEIVSIDFDDQIGTMVFDQSTVGDFDALVIPQPNFFGVLNDIDQLT